MTLMDTPAAAVGSFLATVAFLWVLRYFKNREARRLATLAESPTITYDLGKSAGHRVALFLDSIKRWHVMTLVLLWSLEAAATVWIFWHDDWMDFAQRGGLIFLVVWVIATGFPLLIVTAAWLSGRKAHPLLKP